MVLQITTFRHGTTNPQYDDNGRQIDSEIWEQMHTFECVEGVEFYNAYRNFDTIANTTEQELKHKLFYIELHKQTKQNNIDIKLGDYIQEHPSGLLWKILNVAENEILFGCTILIIRGQRLTNREQSKLNVRDEHTADESHTGR